ncbi:response regulator transcription factor [Paraburkholderia youngii]|uniref:FixJ family two-component response regulator n=1 Tax=Paraburkholderia youngii TaxID=2782701 RepID=A0A7W8L9L9_9BURK|nr:response regulator [Paraburkholderia youngii]MBB5402558.1 FixJ family two-component response regulator [Paraburkholderia youngii]
MVWFTLVVDDDAAVRTAIAGLLNSLGWDVRLFASGSEVLRSNIISDAACLITDVRMPDVTGVELHDRIVRQGNAVPTIFITAFPTPDLRATLKKDGVVAIFEKPVDANELADCIDQILGKP